MNRGLPRARFASALRIAILGWLLIATAAWTAPLHAAVDEGLVWQVRGPKGSVFIAGSMHLLRRERPELPAAIVAAYESSGSLVMEIDNDDIDEQQTAAVMLRAATFADSRNLPAVLGEPRWTALRPVLARLQFPEAFASTLEPWGVAILLTTLEYSRLGFDPAIGVEKQLQDRAARDRKSIVGLETPEFQIGLFDALPMAEQLQLLDMTVEEIDAMPGMVDDLYLAWRSGDVARLDALLLEGYRDMPGLYDDLVQKRNARWLPEVRKLLEREGNTLVVVGALHLVGDRGLIAMLEREGLRAQRFRTKD